MRRSPDSPLPLENPDRRELLKLFGGGLITLGLGGCASAPPEMQKILKRAEATLDVVRDSQEIIRQRNEREIIYQKGPEIYRAMASHTVGLAIPMPTPDGKWKLATIGGGVVIRRVGPPGDPRIYRAILTVKHNVYDSATGKFLPLRILRRAEEPHALDPYTGKSSIGVNEMVDPDSAPMIDTRKIILDPNSDLAAIPLSAIRGYRELLDLPGMMIDTRALMRGDPVLTMNWTPGERSGWRGLRPTIGTILPRELLNDGLDHADDEWPIDAAMYSGDSGIVVARTDDPTNPKSTVLAGLSRRANIETGYSAQIIGPRTISRFTTTAADRMNEAARK